MYKKTTAYKKIKQLKKRIRIIQGGSSASKTVSILLFLIALAQSDKVPTLTSVVSESLPHLKRGAMLDFLNILQTHDYFVDERWNKSDFTYTFETGSKIEFFSIDEPRKVRGPRRDRLFINEANNTPYESFDQLEIRTKEFIFLDYNPASEFWVHTDLIGKRDDIDFIILTYKDNEALDKSIVDSLERRKYRESWWRVYGLGLLGEIEEMIYAGWEVIDAIPHEAKLVRYWLDFGYTNDPTSIGAVYEYNGGIIVDELAYQKELSNSQIGSILSNVEEKALVIADSSEPKSIAEIKLHGVMILPSEKGRDSIVNGIQIVQDQKISITKRSVNTIKEYRNYTWIKDKDGTILNVPIDIWNHSMDGIRYAIVSLKRPPRSGVSIHRPAVRGFNKNG